MELGEQFFHPPSSRKIIRAVTEALKPDDEDLTGRTGRHYREGKQVRPDSEERIFEALAKALIRAGFIPGEPILKEMELPVHDLLTSCIRWHVQRWDNLVGGQRGFAMPVRAHDLMTLAYLRLIVVDLAFRAAAICCLTGRNLAEEQPPLWARENGQGLFLRLLMKRIGGRRLTTK